MSAIVCRPSSSVPSRVGLLTRLTARAFASDAASPSTSAAGESAKGSKNAFDIIRLLPQLGVGRRIQRNLWRKQQAERGEDPSDCYYTLTHVDTTRRPVRLYGVKTWRNESGEKSERITSVHKHDWRYL